MEENLIQIVGTLPLEKDIADDELPTDLFKVASEISDSALAITHNGIAIFANEKLYSTFRKTKEEILGQNLLMHVYPDDVEKAKQEIIKNRKIIYELRVVRGDGVIVHAEVRGHPIRYKGKPCRLLLIRDISRRKMSESRFRNYYNMMNAFPEAVFIHDEHGKILLSNVKGEALLGLKKGETIAGTHVMQYVLPEYHDIIREDKKKILGMEVITGRFIKIKSPWLNEVKGLEVSVVNVEWENGPAIMTICHDTSLEEQIEKSEMAKRVMQSINEHLQWEINEHRRLEKRFQKMIEEKEWLLKEVNHRVKNNLQIITSILNLQINQIQDKRLIPVMREFQDRFYALSSIYSSLYHTDTDEEIDLSRYLKDLTNNLFVSYSDPVRKIAMECHTDSVLMEYDDAITCGLIVNELVSNAIKYAFPGKKKGKIAVTLKQTRNKIKLEVADNGVGIKKDKKQRDNSLGLQLVDSLVIQLRNSVMEKTSGKNGTKYVITFSHNRITKPNHNS